SRQGPFAHQLECTFCYADGTHAVVNPAWPQAVLGDPKTRSLLPEDVVARHEYVLKSQFGVAFAVVEAKDGKVAKDSDAGGVGGDNQHGLLAVGLSFWAGLAHDDEHLEIGPHAVRAKPLPPVKYIPIEGLIRAFRCVTGNPFHA